MKLSLTFTMIMFGAVFGIAQERVIEQAEFDSALVGTEEHRSIWHGQLYRMTVETSVRISGKPESDYSSTILIEFGPNRNNRSVLTNRYGGKTTTEEKLRIGDFSYSKTNGGPWSKTARTSSPSADTKPFEDPTLLVAADNTYFLVGKKPYKEAMATVYRKVENTRKINKSTGTEAISVCTSVYWLVDGVQRKRDLSCQYESPTHASSHRINMQWDLDPAITFNAPL